MSRRKEFIESNQIPERINSIIHIVNDLDFRGIVNSIEADRVILILEHIQDILRSVDNDLFALSSLKILNANVSNIEKHILNRSNDYIESNIINISDNFVDPIISEMEKYNVLKGGKAAHYAKQLNKKMNEVEDYIKIFNNIKRDINNFYQKLFEGEGAIERKVDALIADIEEKQERIEDFENYLYQEDEEGETIISNIKRKLAEINRMYDESKHILNKEKHYFDEIKNHYIYIFGEDEDAIEELGDNHE